MTAADQPSNSDRPEEKQAATDRFVPPDNPSPVPVEEVTPGKPEAVDADMVPPDDPSGVPEGESSDR